MLQVKEHTPIPYSVISTFELTFESFKKFGVHEEKCQIENANSQVEFRQRSWEFEPW
jgi:hypothetical protein